MLAIDDDVVGRAVLEAMDAYESELVRDVPEPKPTSIEEMRAEIGQHPGALIPPSRIPNEPRCAIAVEHAAGIDRAQFPRRDQIPHTHEVRLEAMIIGGVANNAALARQRLEPGDVALVLGPQRLLDQHVLAVLHAIGEELDLGFVGDAG